MRVADIEFIKSTAEFLDKLNMEPVYITRDGQEYAVLTKPAKTPLTDSLVGILKGADVTSLEDIKKMRLADCYFEKDTGVY